LTKTPSGEVENGYAYSCPPCSQVAVVLASRSGSLSIGASAPEETKSGAVLSRIHARSGTLPPPIWVVSAVV
jgi:hypothetical protein